MNRVENGWRTPVVSLFLAIAILISFWTLRDNGIISFDDPQYLNENVHVTSGLTWENIRWALTTDYACNWHPLTWISHMLDAQLFGLNIGWHHLVTLLIHLTNSVLLLVVLRRMTEAFWRSAFVAALFALHPLHVESVAWLCERKDVLSAFFFMLTLWTYTLYASNRRRFYALSFLAFALGLMSKPMLVSAPFVLLLLDFWPLQRFSVNGRSATFRVFSRLVIEKIPFFVLSAASSAVTVLVQGRAMTNTAALPFVNRVVNAACAYVAYLAQTFWPSRLAVFYPLHASPSPAEVVGAVLLLLGISAVVLLFERRLPYLVTGWFWYLGMLVPVIGLVQVGQQARADRYTYLPLIGIFILVAWGAESVLSFVSKNMSSPPRKSSLKAAISGAGVAILIVLAMTAHTQARLWRDSETLFTHAAHVTDDNYAALEGLGIVDVQQGHYGAAMTNLMRALELAERHKAAGNVRYYIGVALQKQGKGLEALPYLQQAVVVPDVEPERRYRLGLSLLEAGRNADAERELNAAVSQCPDKPEYRLGLAALLQGKGESQAAEQALKSVLAEYPRLPQAHRSYGDFLVLTGRPADAEVHYAAALEFAPTDASARRAYGLNLAQNGKLNEAITQLEQAVSAQPEDVRTMVQLAELLSAAGRVNEAVALYGKITDANPSLVAALNNLAWLLATDPDNKLRDGSRAVELAQRACELTSWRVPVIMGTLAAAYAEAGRFSEAVSTAERARDAARATHQDETAKRNDQLLALYRAGKPFHEEQR